MRRQTAREQYDELIADLTTGEHTYNNRPVMEWSSHPGDGAREGKTVVSVQYSGVDSNGGGLLLDYVFDNAALAELEDETEAEAEGKGKPEASPAHPLAPTARAAKASK